MDLSGLAPETSLIESVIHANRKHNKILVYTQNEKSGNGNTDSKRRGRMNAQSQYHILLH